MPYEERIIANNEEFVVEAGQSYKDYIILFSIPSSQAAIKEILQKKKQDKVPKIIRARLIYNVKYDGVPSPYVQWGYDIYMVDCSGNEKKIHHHDGFADKPEDQGDIDITYLYSCNAPALGIQALKLRVYCPSDIYGTGCTMTGKYRATLKVFMSWGW